MNPPLSGFVRVEALEETEVGIASDPSERLRLSLETFEERLAAFPSGPIDTPDALALVSLTLSIETRLESLENGDVADRNSVSELRRRFEELSDRASDRTRIEPLPAPQPVVVTKPAPKAKRLGSLRFGRWMMALGLILTLFFVFEFLLAGVGEARSQHLMLQGFKGELASTAGTVPQPIVGEPIALIAIPSLGLEKVVIEGTSATELQKGPGHLRSSPLPGQPGNAVVAGRRTTYGAPFGRLDELRVRDEIVLTTEQGEFRYEVSSSDVVHPGDKDVLGPTTDNRLTLITSHPKFLAQDRLTVTALLQGDPVPASDDRPLSVDGPESGLTGDARAVAPILVWLEVLIASILLAWLFTTRWSGWTAHLVIAPVVLAALFLLFENLDRVLPSTL